MAGDPRGSYEYQRNSALVLAESDLCFLCGHVGALTVDHIISVAEWLHTYGTYDGVNHPNNLAPAHGMRGPRRPPNRCPECGILCNQRRGSRSLLPQRRSRDW